MFGAIQDQFKEKTTTFVYTAWKNNIWMFYELQEWLSTGNEMLFKHYTELHICGLFATSKALSIQIVSLKSPSVEVLIQMVKCFAEVEF